MSRADDMFKAVQKAIGDKPLYLLAGASDLVNEKLRELPDTLNSLQEDYRDFPIRAAGALVGQAFRANLKVGELYDDLTRRGEQVVAKMRGEQVVPEEDEPFVREPFMPEPVRSSLPVPPPASRAPAKKTAASKAAAKKTTSKKTVAKKTTAKKTIAKKTGTSARRRPPAEA